MTLLERSAAGGLLIAVIALLRPLLRRRAPGFTLSMLWTLAALRLLSPLAVPLAVLPRKAASQAMGGMMQATAPATAPAIIGPEAAFAIPQAGIDWPRFIWIVGASILALYFLGAALYAMRKYHGAVPLANASLPIHLPRRVRVRISDMPGTPLTYGLLRPVILLPSALVFGNTEQLGCALRHELAHIRRFDTLRKALLVVVACAHWFNPLVWLLLHLANRDMELACDESVLRGGGGAEKSCYAHTLLNYAPPCQSTPFAAHLGQKMIAERIRWIMNYQKKSMLSTLLAILLIAATGLAAATAPTSAALDPYAETLDWNSFPYTWLQEFGVTKGADGYPEYEGKPLYAVCLAQPDNQDRRWFQFRWDEFAGEATFPSGPPTDGVFLLTFYEGEEVVDLVPMEATEFFKRMSTSLNAAEEARSAGYAEVGFEDALYSLYNGKVVLGWDDEYYQSFNFAMDDKTKEPYTQVPDDPDAPVVFLVIRYKGDTLIALDEVTFEEFYARPFISSMLSYIAS